MTGREEEPRASERRENPPRPTTKPVAAKAEPEAALDLDLELDEIEPNQRLKEGFTGQER